MRYTLIFTILLLVLCPANAQRYLRSGATIKVELLNYALDKDYIFDADTIKQVITPPQFKGGEKNLLHFFGDHMSYPTIAIENGIQGRVIIQLAIGANGKVRNVTLRRGVDPSLDREAIRISKGLPPWIPATYNGQKVPSFVNIACTFRLN